ncbi:transposase (fragment) [Candidatus Methylobacter favarea]|uniref:Transposase n=1 Tax=Candidatus Methylobacter favarea TaxID=2707345 RepID=A0A8S0XTN4_9GAMM
MPGNFQRFGYRLWTFDFLPQFARQAGSIVRRDVSPGFVAVELLAWLNGHKIIRLGYTTLQELISKTLSAERPRLGGLLAEILYEEAQHFRYLVS